MRYLYSSIKKSPNKNYHYKIADSVYQTDIAIPEIAYLSKSHYSVSNESILKSSGKHLQTYSNQTLIGENSYPLKVSTNNFEQYQLDIENNTYLINKQTILLNSKNIDPIILLGPVMMLNLAINDVFSVHASSFQLGTTTFVLMADSGTGKSTIARYMNEQPDGFRVADDIVPLKFIENKLTILAQFPQLKLKSKEQYMGKDIDSNIVFLFANKSKNKNKILPMTQIEGLKKLIKHTVACKLFSEKELNSHLLFCHNSSKYIPCFQVNYSHKKDSLKNLYQMLYDEF